MCFDVFLLLPFHGGGGGAGGQARGVRFALRVAVVSFSGTCVGGFVMGGWNRT